MQRQPDGEARLFRDKRPDRKQVCIGLVVSKCGMPLGYEVFEGNRNDVKTWKEIVTKMEARYGKADRIWCGDRGMMSKENIEKWRDWATLAEGCYLLRTNVTDWSAEDLWQAYIQLTEAEVYQANCTSSAGLYQVAA